MTSEEDSDPMSPRRMLAALLVSIVFYIVLQLTLLSGSQTVRYHHDPTIQRLANSHYAKLQHLVIVPAEASFRPNVLPESQHTSLADDQFWKMEAANQDHGAGEVLLLQIQTAIKLVQTDIWDMLMFSGGTFVYHSGPLPSATSYYLAAERSEWFDSVDDQVPPRVTIEEFATDALETLLYSLCRFRELTGHYPAKLRVVGFDFKKERYEMHLEAIKWPKDRFEYVSVDTFGYDTYRFRRWRTEEEKLITQYSQDPYGCGTRVLRERRRGRNFYNRVDGYTRSCPQLESMMQFCGSSIYSGTINWA